MERADLEVRARAVPERFVDRPVLRGAHPPAERPRNPDEIPPPAPHPSHNSKGGALNGGTPARDVYRRHWSRLNEVETLWAGLHELEKYGAVQIAEVSDTGGRPTDAIYFHPDLLRTAA